LVNKKQVELKKLITNILQDQKHIEVKVDKIQNMNNKAAKKLRRLSVFIAAGNGKTLDDAKRIYKNLKAVHKENKKAPK
jgi:phosphoheptose isomerase